MSHPVLEAVTTVRGAFKAVGDANPTFMTPDEKATALRELARAGAQLDELRLRILADASDLAATTASHNPAQRKVLLLRDRECRAEGCSVPGTWCEAHHWLPWAAGGSTDVDDGVLLCHHHHQRVHDASFSAARLPDGGVRFHRRT